MRLPVTHTSEPHAWRQTFALLSLAAWTMVVVSWLIIHLIGWFVPPITDWNFVPPPVADLVHVLTVVQTRR